MQMQVLDKRNILGEEVVTYGDVENPLFLARSVADWIEHTDLSRMVGLVDEDEKQQLMEENIIGVKEDLQDFKEEIPLFTVECEEITRLVRKIGTEVLKGKNSKAYKNKSIRSKVYSDIYRQLRREFGVRSYKAIKRRQLDQALESVENYKLPFFLSEEINLLNSNMEGLAC